MSKPITDYTKVYLGDNLWLFPSELFTEDARRAIIEIEDGDHLSNIRLSKPESEALWELLNAADSWKIS